VLGDSDDATMYRDTFVDTTHVAKHAKKYLCISATSVASKRVFTIVSSICPSVRLSVCDVDVVSCNRGRIAYVELVRKKYNYTNN